MNIKGISGRFTIKSYLVSILCVIALVASGAARSVVFTGLGEAFAEIAPDGSFAFNSTSRWTAAGGWETWDSFSGGALTGGVSVVSFDGSIVAGATDSGAAYRWTASSGTAGIGASLSGFSTAITGISDDGNVLAGTRREDFTSNSQAFRWTPATGVADLGTTGGDAEVYANNISADGSVVIGTDVDLGTGYWTADGTWVGITSAVDDFTAASSDGSVITGDFFGGRDVFRWTETDGFSDLGSSEFAFREFANDISYDGSIIVGQDVFLAEDVQNGAWVWDALNGRRSVRDLLIAEGIDLTGWDLIAAESISADGSIIAGFGVGPSGIREAWVADFSAVPLPTAAWLFGSGLLGMIGVVRRKAVA